MSGQLGLRIRPADSEFGLKAFERLAAKLHGLLIDKDPETGWPLGLVPLSGHKFGEEIMTSDLLLDLSPIGHAVVDHILDGLARPQQFGGGMTWRRLAKIHSTAVEFIAIFSDME